MALSADPVVYTSSGEIVPIAGVQSSKAAKVTTGYRGYDHVEWYVGNAKQAAAFYVLRFGFKHVAYKGLETGSRFIASHVVQNGSVRFVLTSPLQGGGALTDQRIPAADRQLLTEIQKHLSKHGDAVKDVAFEVDDVRAVWSKATKANAVSVHEPYVKKDADGSISLATIQTYGDTTHTLVQRSDYRGAFMPGYRAVNAKEPTAAFLPNVDLEAIDHCVGNQDWNGMEAVCQ